MLLLKLQSGPWYDRKHIFIHLVFLNLYFLHSIIMQLMDFIGCEPTDKVCLDTDTHHNEYRGTLASSSA